VEEGIVEISKERRKEIYVEEIEEEKSGKEEL
jgi:hypothetical protein